jgi:hypothetical protein
VEGSPLTRVGAVVEEWIDTLDMNLYWAGDQNTNWGVNDGIKASVTVMGHMGLSGFGE